jgi:hypothetical protein
VRRGGQRSLLPLDDADARLGDFAPELSGEGESGETSTGDDDVEVIRIGLAHGSGRIAPDRDAIPNCEQVRPPAHSRSETVPDPGGDVRDRGRRRVARRPAIR